MSFYFLDKKSLFILPMALIGLIIGFNSKLSYADHGSRERIVETLHALADAAKQFHEMTHDVPYAADLAQAAHELAQATRHLHKVIETTPDWEHVLQDFTVVVSKFRTVQRLYMSVGDNLPDDVQNFYLENLAHKYYAARDEIGQPNLPPMGRDIPATCESRNFHMRTCPVPGIGQARIEDVNLTRQNSNSLCTKGYIAADGQLVVTYGVSSDRTMIWVDRGCRGNFSVRVR